MSDLRISIITVCYNSENTIRDTIESVIGQNYTNIEYIIVDGRSTDGTLEIIQNYKQKISKIISEPDIGMYDAMNKGINIASGELIGFLHSDDLYADSTSIENIINKINIAGTSSIYGDLVYVKKNNLSMVVRKWNAGPFSQNKFKFGWMPPHPTLFIKKAVYDKYGFFNVDFGTAADYELIIRLFYKYKVSCTYLPIIITKMRSGGVSNQSFYNHLKAHINDWRTWINNDISSFPWWVVLKPIRKVPQYLGL